MTDQKQEERPLTPKEKAKINDVMNQSDAKAWYGDNNKRMELLRERVEAEVRSLTDEQQKRANNNQPPLTATQQEIVVTKYGTPKSKLRIESEDALAKDEFKTYQDSERSNRDRA